MKFKDHFRTFAAHTAAAAGRPYAFGLALTVVIIWLLTGPLFGFSDTWQLVINTGTTIITFLMVFLIQNAQNRDTGAIQLKLNELLRAAKGARNELVDLEEMSDEELEAVRLEFREMYHKLHGTAVERGLVSNALPREE